MHLPDPDSNALKFCRMKNVEVNNIPDSLEARQTGPARCPVVHDLSFTCFAPRQRRPDGNEHVTSYLVLIHVGAEPTAALLPLALTIHMFR